MTRWGIVATIKAPLPAIRAFAAWHLDHGAARLVLFLDDADSAKAASLSAHPAIHAIATDAAYWQARGRRPGKHQVRQSVNATHAVRALAHGLDWLAHLDVDEYLLPPATPDATPDETPAATPGQNRAIAQALAALPAAALCARVRPAEALAPGGAEAPGETLFKAFALDRAARRAATRRVFGADGAALNGGLLSHVAGKLFLRPAAGAWDWRLHNAWLAEARNPGEAALPAIPLGHFHAPDRDSFAAKLAFRRKRGSYRAELAPAAAGGETLHDTLARIEAAEGRAGLLAFYDRVARATPTLAAALQAEGLLIRRRMDLPARVARRFGDADHPRAAATAAQTGEAGENGAQDAVRGRFD